MKSEARADIARRVGGRLRGLCHEAYLYGSCIDNPEGHSDIDVLVVVYTPADKCRLAEALLSVQTRYHRVVHPTFVTEADLSTNPMFRAIRSAGVCVVERGPNPEDGPTMQSS